MVQPIFLFTLLAQGLVVGAIRDGGIDPANLGKGEWLFYMSSATNGLGGYVPEVADENSLMQYLKNQGTRYIIVKAATSDQLFNGSYSHPQFTSELVQAAHAHGLWIFGYNRSYGQNIAAEIAIADYVFQQGADGFVWDAEAEWESYQSWIGTNGPALAWELCSTVRSNWPNKFLAHSPFAIISLHSSFPYKEFGYWCDAVMPQIYHFSAARIPSAAINWTDVNWHYYQNLWRSLPPQNIDGLGVYWTNSIKPIVPIQDVYGPPFSSPTPDKDVQEFIDYLAADPHTPAVGGYAGANFFRADLHDAQQWAYINQGTLGNAPGVVNNLVLDDAAATVTGVATPVRTYYLTNNTTPRFEGSGSGTDRNSFGTNYIQLTQGTGNNYVQFTPIIPIAGEYRVYQWHPERAEASASVPFIVHHSGGTTTIHANQQTNSGNWSLLGTFTFAAGTSGSIRVTDAIPEAGGIAMADGIKLAFASPAAVLPLAPSGVTADALASSQIAVNWINHATNAVHNVVSRSTTSSGPYQDVAILPSSSTSCVDKDLAGQTTYYYLVRAVNAAGNSTSSGPADATTLAAPPVITQEPASQIVSVSSQVMFTVVAASALPLGYQWKREGTNIAGATQSSYSIPSVQMSHAGLYSVTVTNSAGSATSLGFTLTVLPQLVALNVSVTPGGTVTKSPNASAYVPGTIVGLTATPSGGYTFSGWSGDVTSKDNPLWVTMNANVSITATFAPVMADIILDNTNSAVTFVGAWSTGTTAAGRYGNDYRFASTIFSGTPSTATYRPALPIAGFYRIYTMYPAGGNRAYSTPFTLQTDSGQIQVTINQQQNGGIWLPLVSEPVHLSPDNDVYVEISNFTGYSGNVVIADAVRFELVEADPAEPTIITEPADRIVSVGGTASFSLGAKGAAPLSYQWLRNGQPIAGATESIYTTNNVQSVDSGDEFRCLLGNTFGQILSSSAYLTVVEDETYVFAATFENGLDGFTTANLYGAASSLWHRSTGKGIEPGHSPTHSLYYGRNEGPAGGGNYNTGAANGGTATSPVISLPAVEGPIWLSFNYLMQVQYGVYYDTAYVEVTADGGASYTLVAQKDSFGGLVSVTSNTSTNFAIPTWVSNRIDLAAFAGSDIQLRFRFDTIDSFNNSGEGWYIDDVAITAPARAPAVVENPQDLTQEVGVPATFAVVASGAYPLSYYWQRNGQPIEGATESAYTLFDPQLTDSGSVFSCLVSNTYGIAPSAPAVLTVVGYPPWIFSQPWDQTVYFGEEAAFSVFADGTAPLGYTWYRDGAPIPGGTGATYQLPPVSGADSGSMFSCVVTNAFGNQTSVVATLTVIDPAIIIPPFSQDAQLGASVTLGLTAIGSQPLHYQWWKDGVALAETSPELTIASVQAGDAGQYWTVVSNNYGSVTSSVATLSVNLATVDLAFQPNANGSISTTAIQPDGKILIAGWFTEVDGKQRNYLARLNSDGSVDDSFNPGANDSVLSIVVQPDGKILVGGYFTTLAGQSRNRIGRLNPDGSLDTSFNAAPNDAVVCMALQDGRVVIGGNFLAIGSTARDRIARLNSDGSVDTGFNPGANDSVQAVLVQPDGRILVGGYFTILGGQSRYRVARLNSNGTLDSGVNAGVDGGVSSLALQPDGKILVGGYFTVVGNEQYRPGIARLNADGSPDAGFDPATYYYTYVYALGLQTDGKILVGGSFSSMGGQSRQNLARLHPDGAADATFNPAIASGVNCLAIQPDGKVLAGGWFGTYLTRLHSTSDPAEELTRQTTSITWMRGGTSPEVWRTLFEYSTNAGASWVSLGTGIRTPEGWLRTIPSSLPPANIRARGFVADSRSASLIQSIIGPLLVISQPSSQTRNAGAPASFTVTVGGTLPLVYQWFKDGQTVTDDGNVSGAQNSTLTLASVYGSDAGAYSVVISNIHGSITSSVATLTVFDPVITSHPSNESRNLGDSMTLGATAAGSAPLSYQWWKDGSPLEQGTEESLTIANLQGTDAGQYFLVVSNHFGVVTSQVAMVSVNLAIVDGIFDPQANGSVITTVVQPDGKILVGGWFYYMGGLYRPQLARLNADGTVDEHFNPSPNSGVSAIALQQDGKILIGGTFDFVGQTNRSRIARLNPDGTVDSTFASSANDMITGLAVQPDGKIIVVGYFTTLAGQSRSRIGRLNPNGTLDTTFGVQANGPIYTLAMQNDGRILVGGAFTTLGGPRSRIGRITSSGALDSTFNSSADNDVYSIVVQPDGKIIVGGWFGSLGGQSREKIGRLNSNGTLDTSFNPGLGGTFSSEYVYALALQTDGKILVGGLFSSLAGQQRSNIGRLNANGTADISFNPNASYFVGCLAIQKDGKVLVGGSFSTLGGYYRQYLGRLNSTGEAVENFSYQTGSITWMRAGTGPEVFRTTFEYSTNAGSSWLSIGSGIRVIDGWQCATALSFGNANIRTRGFIADGRSSYFVQSIFGPLLMVSQPLSRTNNAGTPASFIVETGGSGPLTYQWFKDGVTLTNDGTLSGVQSATLSWSSVFGVDAGNYSVVISNTYGSITSAVARLTVIDPIIAIQPVSLNMSKGETASFSVGAIGSSPLSYQWWKDGSVLAQGNEASLTITNVQAADAGLYTAIVSNQFGSATSEVAVLTVNLATVDENFDPRANSAVYATAVQPDGKILVGGWFDNLAGVPRARIARLNADGTVDETFNPGANDAVFSIAVQPDGKILVGGAFTTLAGSQRQRIARLNSNGTVDNTFNSSANDYVFSLAVQQDGKILAAGYFTSISSQNRNRIARLNPNGTVDSNFNAAANDVVFTLALQPDGKVLVGGGFTTLTGQNRTRLGRLNSNGTLDTSFAPDPNNSVYAVALQPDGKIVVGGSFYYLAGVPRNGLGRLNSDGTADTSFDPAGGYSAYVYSLALQADGKIIVGGSIYSLGGQVRYNLGRIHSDGSVDSTFNAWTDSVVYSLAIQSDGKLIVGGSFWYLGNQVRQNIGRLNSTDPALESFVFGESNVSWHRGGTSPEFWQTALDYSTNGITWQSFGAGTRMLPAATGDSPGWRWTDLPLSLGSTVRLRGFVTGGGFSGSSWFNETNIVIGAPQIVSQPVNITRNVGTDASFSVVASGPPAFSYQWLKNGTNLSGAIGPSLVLTNVQEIDQGAYAVVVSNAFGFVLSSEALLVVNQAPIADASATLKTVISPNGIDAKVVFDGTLSSDPDDDLLSYEWLEPQTHATMAHGAVAVLTMPTGTHSMLLVVSDGLLLSTNSVTVEVLTASTAVERLAAAASAGVARSQQLIATLSAALASIDRSNPISAINQLQAFQNQVLAQVYPIDPTLAQEFIDLAQSVIEALNQTPGNSPPGAKLSSVAQPGRGLRMHFPAPRGPLYIVEASTNLLSWEMIGVATDRGDGSFEFEDKHAVSFRNRYYRIVLP